MLPCLQRAQERLAVQGRNVKPSQHFELSSGAPDRRAGAQAIQGPLAIVVDVGATSEISGSRTATNGQPAIEVRGLTKSYGKVRALCGVDLDVTSGSVLGLLGPNGAGKTTMVRILTTLLKPDGGSARVAGLDVVQDAARLREQIGLAGQYAAVDENLTGLENLRMVGRLYGMGKPEARERGRELLERFELSDAADRPAKTSRAECGAGWIWRRRWWPSRRSCSWTSRPPAWILGAASASGR